MESKEFGPGHPEYEAAKKEIVEEGWEGDEEGGAAVIIGNASERQQQRARLEQEDPAENLATYIKLHRRLAIPKEYLENLKNIEKMPELSNSDFKTGDAVISSYESKKRLESGFYVVCELTYFDKEGNISEVMIDTSKIKNISDDLEEELNNLGFKILPIVTANHGILQRIKQRYEKKILAEIEYSKKEGFDF
ncbi:MAG: hypothetical protein Q8Q06_00870 [bacterium]|nr:hypothetical protein [bacterium]